MGLLIICILALILAAALFDKHRYTSHCPRHDLRFPKAGVCSFCEKIAKEEEEEERLVVEEKRRLIDEDNYNHWLQEMPAKLSQGGFSSLGGKDRDELFLIYQLLMNGGELNQTQNRLLEIALADPATSKFLELRGSQGNMPSPTTSLSPQMTGAFSALGIAGAAGIMQRGQIRQELNEINENLADNGGGDAGGGEASGDFGGFM